MGFKLRKTKKPDVCDATRCPEKPEQVFEDGAELCPRHAGMYAPVLADVEGAPLTPGGPEALSAVGKAIPASGETANILDRVVRPAEVEAVEIRDKLSGFKITNQAGMEAAGEVISMVHTKLKDLEKQRKLATDPLTRAKKEIDSWFRPAKDALASAKDALKSSMDAYMTAQQRARIEALAAGDHNTAMDAAPAALPAGVTQITRWAWRVTDAAAVPREFLCVDVAKVQAIVNEQRHQTCIPGIEAYTQDSIRMSGAR